MQLVHASTFSGIGGAEVAASMLGWENAFHCEINPFGRKILEYYYPNAKSYEDITKTDFSEWRGRIDVLTGGFPCQPFSVAGQRRGAEDDRYLWPFMLKAIDEIRPTWFVGENVAGIVSMVLSGKVSQMGGNPSLFDEGDHYERTECKFVVEEICSNLEGIGYSVQPMLIPACAVGAPHRRDRIFFIAYDAQESNSLRRGQRAIQEPQHKRLKRNAGAASADGQIELPTSYADDRERESRMQRGAWNENSEEDKAEVYDRTARHGGQWDAPRLLNDRWRNFPSVSPIHRGNDGLPFDVDNLTIPFTKWRTESLKAYGNAIVPQVMYEIFKAIEETYATNNHNTAGDDDHR